MQPVQEDIMALLNHHAPRPCGRRDDAARALTSCCVAPPSMPGFRPSAALCAAELKICPTTPTVVKHGMHRNIDGLPTIPRVTIHDPVTNVHGAAPGTPDPLPHPTAGGSKTLVASRSALQVDGTSRALSLSRGRALQRCAG
eukprot:2993017-Prymnesium_polylepis.1